MKKTPNVFVMNHETNVVENAVKPGSEWVLNGEGVATVKFDGTSTMWKDGILWKRYDRKLNKTAARRLKKGEPLSIDMFKEPPTGFVPCEENPDPVTYHWPGWAPIDANDPNDHRHVEALESATGLVDGKTYELVGPTLAGNVYGLERHELWEHGSVVVDLPVVTFDTIRDYLISNNIEGFVFHHPDGRLAKIRRKDFCLNKKRDYHWYMMIDSDFV